MGEGAGAGSWLVDYSISLVPIWRTKRQDALGSLGLYKHEQNTFRLKRSSEAKRVSVV